MECRNAVRRHSLNCLAVVRTAVQQSIRDVGSGSPRFLALELHLEHPAGFATLHALRSTACDVVLLVVDRAALDAEVRVEGLYPHIYGPLPTSAVVDARPVELGADGTLLLGVLP